MFLGVNKMKPQEEAYSYMNLFSVLNGPPQGIAYVMGSKEYPDIHGVFVFYQTKRGVLVVAEVNGLPTSSDPCEDKIFALHMHSGESCTGKENDPFSDSMGHYNPYNCPHPYHVGDFPPLFENNGYAFMMFVTDRFVIDEIIGKTIIIHEKPDDFVSQPSGNAGKKIACGKIMEA